MKKTRLPKKAITILLAMVMLLSMVPAVFAAGTQIQFPLIALNGQDLVANANTQYVTNIVQDPATKLITATITLSNGNTGAGALPIVITGVGVELSFDNRISPYRYNPAVDGSNHPYDATRLYSGGPSDSIPVFRNYVQTPTVGFDTVGSSTVQNNADGRFIGAKVSTVDENTTISLAPGQSAVIAQMYFMPTNGQDVLDLDMFSFSWSVYPSRMIRLSTWIANGTRFVVSNINYPTSTSVWVHAPNAFKIDFERSAPNVTANFDTRTVVGYNTATMEWSYSANGPYQSGAPVVLDEANVIHVRYAATAYSGNDAEYGNYKRFLASEATAVPFDPNFFSAANDVSLNKTSENITRNDGTTRVNDTIRYTVTAKNDGHPMSTWANGQMVDTMPAGVTFAGNVVRNNVPLTQGTGYTFTGNTLTVPLGNINGGSQVIVTFDVTVNPDAYGTLVRNSVSVFGKDGVDGDDLNKTVDEDGPGHVIRSRSADPTIDPLTEGDRVITGTGVPAAQIVLTLPNGATNNITVPANGTWSFNVPLGVNLVTGNEVKAVQNETGKDTSAEVTAIVGGRPAVIKFGSKTSQNLTTRTDGTWRVGDTIEYTVIARNDGPEKSLWENVIVVDELPTEVTFVAGSATIDNNPAGGAATYANGILTVNLGDIPGGVAKTLRFRAVINETAYGKTFKNTAVIDGEPIEEPEDPPIVVDRSPQPTVDEINDGDRIVTGTGVPGARIEVTFPNFITKGIATVAADGKWSVNVPVAVNLVEGDEVSVVQIVGALDPSIPVVMIVQAKKNVVPNSRKYSENKTSTDDKTRVNDLILYTIEVRNDGSDKSLWYNAEIRDIIPAGLTFVVGSVRLDNQIPTYHFYNTATRELHVRIDGGVVGGQTRIVTFEATVNPDAYGMEIKNTATVIGRDNIPTGPEVKEEIEEEGDPRIPIAKSDKPTVDPVTRDDDKVTGTGEPGSKIVVTLDDGTPVETTVGNDGNWTANIPPGKEPDTGDTIKVVQTEPNKDPSDEVIVIVLDKTYRAVTGLVWPQESNDQGLGITFLQKHDIVVELRPTFTTAADPALRTVAVLAPNAGADRGRFTIENVPFGSYVLTIKRPGFLVRAMNVTISPSDPDMITLAPPGTADNGVFNLWWGDCNDDFRIDNEDIMMILELMELDVNATHTLYNANCDMNADGLIDNEDIMMVIERWNRYASEYPGAENVNFFG